MLRRFVTKKHLVLYFFSIAITWLEAIITPALVQNIVASFTNQELGLLWKVLILGILGNLILLLGLAGKRYYYARLITDLTRKIAEKLATCSSPYLKQSLKSFTTTQKKT